MAPDGLLGESSNPAPLPGDDEGRRAVPLLGDLGASRSAVLDARGAHRRADELGPSRGPARRAPGGRAVLGDRKVRRAARSLRTVPLPGVCMAAPSRRRRLPVAGRAPMAVYDAGEHARVSVTR